MNSSEKAHLCEAQRARNKLLSGVKSGNDTISAVDTNAAAPVCAPLRAALQAPPVRRRQTLRTPAESHPNAPPGSAAHSSRDEGALATAFNNEIQLVRSPFPQRRATILFTPFDLPWDGERGDPSVSEAVSSSILSMVSGDDITDYVVPSALPASQQKSANSERNGSEGEASPSTSQVTVLTLTKDRKSAYSRPLTFVMSEDAVPFTAVLTTLAGSGFSLVKGRAALMHKTWSLLWIKRPLKSDYLAVNTAKFQKLNHFPGTWRIGKKDTLHLQLISAQRRWEAFCETNPTNASCRMHARGVKTLFPRGWIIPDDFAECTAALRAPENAGKLFIVKPAASACGRGMSLLRGGENVEVPLTVLSDDVPTSTQSRVTHLAAMRHQQAKNGDCLQAKKVHDRLLVQRYIDDPFLVHGYKFDLRLYVVVTSYEPCRFYLYKEGLVRFATTPYRKQRHGSGGGGSPAPIDELTAHLTNFTINKKSEDFVAPQRQHCHAGANGVNEEAGTESSSSEAAVSKWCLAALEAHVKSLRATSLTDRDDDNCEGALLYDWDATLSSIHDLLCTTFLSVTSDVRNELAELHEAHQKGANSEGAAAPSPPFTFRGVSPFFEIYGVDVLLREPEKETGSGASSKPQPLRPVLMEVNIMPSLSTHYSPLDQCVKGNFIADMFTLVGLSSTALKPPGKPTARPGAVAAASANSPSTTSLDRGGQGESQADVTYNSAFLDSLTSPTALEACLTAEEERLRSPNFTRLMPTATSAAQYAPLLSAMRSLASSCNGEANEVSLDQVLSEYEASRRRQE